MPALKTKGIRRRAYIASFLLLQESEHERQYVLRKLKDRTTTPISLALPSDRGELIEMISKMAANAQIWDCTSKSRKQKVITNM